MSDLKGKSYWEIKTAKNCGKKTLDELANVIVQLQSPDSLTEFIGRISVEKQEQQGLASNFLTEKIYIPESMRGLSLIQLPLSVRLANALRRTDFYLLGDLHGIEFKELKELRNCGNKTIKELKQLIEKVQNGGLPELGSAKEMFDVLPHEASFADFLNFIENFLIKLPDKKRDILLLRFGGIDNKPLTLEEVGDKYKLTRERIRQIQSKTLKFLKDLLGDDMLQKISRDCLTAVCPFTPQLLLHWAGEATKIQYQPAFYVRLLAELSSDIPALPESQIKPGNVPGRLAEIRREIKELLTQCDVPERELASVFYQIRESDAIVHFSEKLFLEAIRFDNSLTLNFDISDKPTIKLNDKPKAIDLIRRVLLRSESPLTPEEILERAKEFYGDAAAHHSPFSLANAAHYKVGIYLLDKRALGLRKHFRLPENRWSELRNDFYDLLKEHKRPFSTTDIVARKVFDWAALTNASEAAQILREDERFTDLRRFHFALAEWQIEERGYLRDLIVQVLEKAGHPLTSTEILEQMQKARSVAPTSMPTILSQNENVKNVGAGFYGLKKWGNEIQDYLVANRKFVNRTISRSQPPLTFSDLCRKLKIAETATLADKLWCTLQSLPKVRLKPNE